MDLDYPQTEKYKILEYLGLKMIDLYYWIAIENIFYTPFQKT